MGGSTAGWVNLASNLLLVHASINVAFEADAGVASYAVSAGWKVRGRTDPGLVPVRYRDGWWLLDEVGGRVRVDVEPAPVGMSSSSTCGSGVHVPVWGYAQQ